MCVCVFVAKPVAVELRCHATALIINDLPENIRSSVRLLADDGVLYRNIESPMDCQILQDDLNSLAQWESDWQMKFNVAKCNSMRVTRHPLTSTYNLTTHCINKDWNRFSPPNTLDSLSQMTWIEVNIYQKFQLRQLRQWVFFGAIWPLHLGTLRKLHTKHWFTLSSSMQHLFGIPIMKLRLDRWRRCRGQLSGGPAGDEHQ